MATSVGLNMKMTASIAKFQSSMDKVEQKLKAIEHSGKQTASGMKLLAGIEVGKLLVGGLTKVAGLASSAASSVTGFASQAADAADKIGKLATMTGMAEEPLQVFMQMAAYGGVSSTQFGDALQKMSKGLGEAAQGSGTAKKALEHLGIPLDSLLKMSPEQQFMKLAAAIDNLKDPTEKSAIAAELFGKSGTKLIPMFEGIEANAKATAQEMLSLAQVLSKDQVKSIEAMNDSFEKVRKTAFMIGSQVLASFAPAIQKANENLLKFIQNFEYNGLQGGQAFVSVAADTLESVVQAMADAFDWFLNTFAGTAEGIVGAIAMIADLGAQFAAFEWGADSQISIDLTNISLKADHAATKLGNFESTVGQNVAELLALRPAVGDAAQAVHQFEQEAKTIKWSGLTGGVSEVTQAVGSLSQYLPTFEGVASKTADTLGLLSDPSNAVKASLDSLNTSAVDVADRFGITSELIADVESKLLYSQSLTSQFGQVAGNFANALSAVFSNGPTVVANGLNSLAGDLLDVLAPLGYTRDKIIELGQAAEAHKDFKQKLIDTAMADWDSVAKQRLQYYINQGQNPFEMFHKMYAERQKMLEQVTGKVNDAEHEWIAASGGITGQMDITKDAIKASGEKLGEKLAEAGAAAMHAFEGVSDFFGGLFEAGENLMPELEELGPELTKQTSTLSDILEAVKQQVLQPVTI